MSKISKKGKKCPKTIKKCKIYIIKRNDKTILTTKDVDLAAKTYMETLNKLKLKENVSCYENNVLIERMTCVKI